MKWIICSLALFGAMTVQAQTVSVSPYSSFGVGEQLFNNNAEQGAMGGISTVPTNPYGQNANFSNPAANQNIRMTNFNVSARGDNSSFESGAEKKSTGSFKLSNVSLAFPVSKKGSVGVGFQPYTGLGYNVLNTSERGDLKQTSSMKGEGGINSIHAFYNHNIASGFSVGIRANYLFGALKTNELVSLDGASLLTDYDTKANYRGIQFTLGSMYQKKIGKNNNLYLGAYYTIGSDLNTDLKEMTSTYTFMGSTPASIDTVSYFRNSDVSTKLPHTIAFGASYTKDNAWALAGEVKFNTWSNFEKPTLSGANNVSSNTEYKNNMYVGVGGYWIPDFNSYKSYLNRVIYRAGVYYESASFSVYGQDINRYGVTLGAGLPVGKTNDGSMINLALEYGQKGTDSYGLIKENYFGVKVGFDLNDVWFRKRVID
ncbi:MAG: aromatic hydrocarbon degradation protein [Flavobacteriaceae bacterium]|nr:aromatic hydrocarbon degradation protein [Candidatus Onthonaster equi]